jgi:thiol peroxidase
MENNITIITCEGKKLTLHGNLPSVGEKAPEFKVINTESKDVKLSDFDGKIKIISTVPSVDATCFDDQIIRMNELAHALPEVVFLAISKDLPFALRRYCKANTIDKVIACSDHRFLNFGNAYRLVIDELKLIARTVMVLDRNNIIQHIENFARSNQFARLSKGDGYCKTDGLNDVS